MTRFFAAAMVMTACAVLTAPPASATQTLSASTTNYAGAPFTLDACSATLADTDFGNVDYYFRPDAAFTNRSARTIVALKILFVVRDGFDDELERYIGLDDTRMPRGTQIEGSWEWINIHSTARTVTCMPYAARFSDGTTWTNDFRHAVTRRAPKPRRTAAPHPATPGPSAHRQPANGPPGEHPATCRVTLADKSQIEIPWNNPGCASARKSFAARTHPRTCTVLLADGRPIEIPWDNAGCADVRRAWINGGTPPPANASPAAAPASRAPATVMVDYNDPLADGHPVTCVLRTGDTEEWPRWETDVCAPARAEWAAQPQYMRETLWDEHDGAPANLENGHPKFCTPSAYKGVHEPWSAAACQNARLKWEKIQSAPHPRR